MKTLYLPIGNIGTGKTTWAKRHITKNNVYLSCDAFRYAIGCGIYRFNKTTEFAVKQTLLDALNNFLKTDMDIILDMAGMCSLTWRERVSTIAKLNGYKVIAVVLPKISMDKAVARRLKDPHGQFSKSKWEEVWTMFDNMYIEPNLMNEIYLDKIMYVKP